MTLGRRGIRPGTTTLVTATVLAAALAGCSTKAPETAAPAAGASPGANQVKTDVGISGDTITLGVITDLTGPFAALGNDITNSQRQYWEKQNTAGGVCGKYKVKLDVKDGNYVVQQGVQLYSGMKDSVLAMQQVLGSPLNTALAEALQGDTMTSIPSAWARNLTENPGAAVVGATYDVEMINALGYALEQKLIKDGDTIGHIYFEGEYGANGLAGAKYMATKHNFKILESKVKATDTDMSPQITQFKAAGVKAIALTISPAGTASAVGVAAQQGLNVPIFGNNPVFAPGLLGGPAAAALKKNLYVASPVSLFDKNPELAKTFEGQKVLSSGLIFGTASGDVMNQILDKACASGDLTREGVLKAKSELTDVQTNGLVTPLNYSEVGASPSKANYILQPADVPGALKTLSEAYEAPDVEAFTAAG